MEVLKVFENHTHKVGAGIATGCANISLASAILIGVISVHGVCDAHAYNDFQTLNQINKSPPDSPFNLFPFAGVINQKSGKPAITPHFPIDRSPENSIITFYHN